MNRRENDAKKRIESRSPITGEVLGYVPLSGPAEVKHAFREAAESQKIWYGLGVKERNRILKKLIGVMLDRADEIGRVVSLENGKPRGEAIGMILPISGVIDLHTKMALKCSNGRKVSSTFFLGAKARIFFEPVGTVGFILPWNFPFESGIKHMIPALAAGNAVVQKPSPFQPLIGELVKSLFLDAGIPEGLVQMVHGAVETGKAVVENADAVCFIGSSKAGHEIAVQAAQRLIPCVLELGGNDPAIVRQDADIDLAARGLVNGTCFNAGQVCNGVERIYVHKRISDDLIRHLLKWVRELKIHDGKSPHYDIGPITWGPQEQIYQTHLADALSKGAKLHTGGTSTTIGNGKYWLPTVLSSMTHNMTMMREETFGPFLPVMTFDNDEQAIRLANDSQYGLAASIWSNDIAMAKTIASRLKGGHIMINNAVQSGGCATLPFGGRGESGVGRLSGEQAFYNWVAQKSLMQSPKMARELWMPYSRNVEKAVLGLAKGFYGRSPVERASGWLSFLKNK